MKRFAGEKLGYTLLLFIGIVMLSSGFDSGVSGEVVLIDDVFKMPKGLTFCSPGDNLEMVACRINGRPYGASGDNSFVLDNSHNNKLDCAKDAGVPICNLEYFYTNWRNIGYTTGITGKVVEEIRNPFDRVKDLANWN